MQTSQAHVQQPGNPGAPTMQPVAPAPMTGPSEGATAASGMTHTHYQPTQYQTPQPQQQPQVIHQPVQRTSYTQQQIPQQAQAPAPPQFTHQGLNGGWQSDDKDFQERRKMIAKIVHLLQQRKPNAPQEWLKKLPQMAKRLEESLYRSAKSFDEYNDATTLKHRLQQLAVNIGIKTKKMQLAQQKIQAQQKPIPGQHTQYRPPVPTQPQQSQQLVRPQAPQVQARTAIQQPAQPPARIVNVAEINPIMGGQTQPQHVVNNIQTTTTTVQATTTQPTGQPVQVQYQSQPAPVAPVGPPQPPDLVNGTRPGSTRQVSDRQQVLRHQQQRLLLLRHAAKCQHEDGKCVVTPHCAGMKRLWKHIAECKDQNCKVPHCVSSRYVLSHYHRCKDVGCPVCGPVREAIHRSHEKQKQMQALKQRHQQAVQQTQLQSGKQDSAPAPPPAPVIAQPVKSSVQSSVIPGPISAPVSAPTPPGPVPVPSAAEPPNKKRRTSGIVQPPPPLQVQSGPPIQQPPIPHPPSARPPAPPTTKPASQYVYSGTAQPTTKRPSITPAPGLAFSNGQVIMPKHTGPKPQEDHTLINCFSTEQIETHINSLNKGLQLPPQKLKAKCLEVLKVLQSHQHGWVFNNPVDPIELGLPDYFEVIKKPMDLGTIRKKLENNCYHSLEEFEGHVLITFDNAMLYNPVGSVVYNMAKEMKTKFEQDYKVLINQLNAEEDIKRKNGDSCSLCGCEKLLFEPPVFYCNGMNCPSKRIRRNSYYYVAGNNQYHWCHQCYQELKENQTIELGEISVKKESLTKKKNDEVHEESWVQCDRCERWVHQICALFNTRQNKDQRSEYCCPRCTIEDRKKKGQKDPVSSTPMAEDLPRTKLSEYLESTVRKKVDEYVTDLIKEKAENDKLSEAEARKQLNLGGNITIRQVTSMDRKLEVRERMKRRYAFKKYPDEFSFRCKCLIVFQNLDGVDLILFGLYVYEHDEKNPPPNQRAVYISYLDSVHYMRPRLMRTLVYHEILISYLDYVRKRGFSTAHIWACPPLKGDDYILYAKPEDQKTPKDDRLRQWYIDMLIECQRRGVVGKLTNMYDLYFSNKANDATVVPYMDGDYFPAEVENIIKDIEEGKSSKKGGDPGKKKKGKSKQKKKSGRGGTRSTGLDEEALKASGIGGAEMEFKSIEDGGRDYVMTKLGETIQPMKESFIVAYLAWEGAKAENMVVPKDIQEYRDKHGIVVKVKEQETEKKPATKGGEGTKNGTNGEAAGENGKSSAGEVKSDEKDKASKPEGGKEAQGKDGNGKSGDDKTSTADTGNGVNNADPKKGNFKPSTEGGNASKDVEMADASESASSTTAGPAVPAPTSASAPPVQKAVVREGKFAAMAARKRDREGKEKNEPQDKSKGLKGGKAGGGKAGKDKNAVPTITVRDSQGRTVKVIDDDSEEMDCEFLNNRQAFLNLCQGNHYQFDQLRRAKHSSMMVLWHLHNRDAPKFVQQCATCSREILSGFRYHCPTCADFDQCQECVSNPNTPRHPHQLKPIPVSNGQQTEITEAQRKERQRSIQLHMTLLLHAATCTSSKCPSANCTKMKGLLKHGAQCTIKATGGCSVCKRIWALLQIHARQCKATNCPVPNCMAVRERVRQLKKQQQAMDDRRRQEMNRAYRGAR